jgi:hypothetical protein
MLLIVLPGLLFGAACGALGFALGAVVASRHLRELRTEIEEIKRQVSTSAPTNEKPA